MDRITVTGLDSGGANSVEFTLNTKPIEAIVEGRLLIQNTAAKTGAGDAHTHHAIEVLNSATAADSTTFVGINDGAGAAPPVAVGVSAAGGGTDFYMDTGSEAAHAHPYANPVYSNVALDVKTTWPATPDSGDIMLTAENKIRVYDDLDVEDVIEMLVIYKGDIFRP